jgi:plasmid stabilization system protein ParE
MNSINGVRVELHPEARAELRSAALWYDQRRVGLGGEFIAEVATILDRIREAVDSFPKWPGSRTTAPPIRRATLRRFPYVIAFESNGQEVLVLAVSHGKRRPLYWLSRAGN